MRWKKNILIVAVTVSLFSIALSIPGNDVPRVSGAGNTPFAWNRNQMWQELENRFRNARAAGCSRINPEIRKLLQEGGGHVAAIAQRQFQAADPFFDTVEGNLFSVGPLVAACPELMGEYAKVVTSLRDGVKLQSTSWDVRDRQVRDRLYRLLYGGRAALEEVMLQASTVSRPMVVHGRNEPSSTPFFNSAGVELHSGDILASRGGAPTSALIARGNDYPGNFSHVALLYVDEATGIPSIIESHIERGVVLSTLDEYVKDVKLRVMVLRVRSDHPLLAKDPMLPHRAAKAAYDEARQRHIPYDFAMDFHEPSRRFCSEVVSHAYSSFGVTLWNIITTMSSPGVVNWLADFGVRHFETEAPADLEYDPELVVVAEWRDMAALWDDHVDSAVTDAMLEGADRGDRLSYNWYLLAPARVVKAYSAVLNLFGKAGPIPEGMSARTALKSRWLDTMHKKTKLGVLAAAASFEQKKGYRPPYWELVEMAEDAYGEAKSGMTPAQRK